jgi:DNA-binding transcriptional ArsR family regulator
MLVALSALAEPNRLRIVGLLRGGPQPVGRIGERLSLRQPQVSKHLRVLKEAGWVDAEVVAQQRRYALRPEPFLELQQWLEDYRQLWDARFDELAAVVEELKQAEGKGRAPHGKTTK